MRTIALLKPTLPELRGNQPTMSMAEPLKLMSQAMCLQSQTRPLSSTIRSKCNNGRVRLNRRHHNSKRGSIIKVTPMKIRSLPMLKARIWMKITSSMSLPMNNSWSAMKRFTNATVAISMWNSQPMFPWWLRRWPKILSNHRLQVTLSIIRNCKRSPTKVLMDTMSITNKSMLNRKMLSPKEKKLNTKKRNNWWIAKSKPMLMKRSLLLLLWKKNKLKRNKVQMQKWLLNLHQKLLNNKVLKKKDQSRNKLPVQQKVRS